MNLLPQDVKSKKIVGRLKKGGKTAEIHQVACKGGLNILVTGGNDGEVLGVGSHPAIARMIASRNPGVTFTDLAKGNYVDEETLKAYLPEFEAMTAQAQRLWAKK